MLVGVLNQHIFKDFATYTHLHEHDFIQFANIRHAINNTIQSEEGNLFNPF